jgi:4'-phosphopantetheinyl transferase
MQAVVFKMSIHKSDFVTPPPILNLFRGTVHIWLISLDEEERPTKLMPQILSTDEADRAGRFHFTKDRARFTIARSALRRILGIYLAMPPQDLQFEYGKHGKPRNADWQNTPDIQFNLSHSGEYAQVGITIGA